MSNLAANPSASPRPRLCMATMANESSSSVTAGDRARSSYGVIDSSTVAAMAEMNFLRRDMDENFARRCVCQLEFRLLPGHCFGADPAPCGSSLFCFGYAALRVTVSLQILFGKYAEKISRDPP